MTGWQRLERLRTVTGDQCRRAEGELRRELQRLELVLEMIATLEAERDAIVTDEAPAHLNARQDQGTLPGSRAIGPELATVLVGEVFYRSFDNRRQVGSYVGFAASPFSSGAWRASRGSARPAIPRLARR